MAKDTQTLKNNRSNKHLHDRHDYTFLNKMITTSHSFFIFIKQTVY